MALNSSEAYLLLTIPHASLHTPNESHTGILYVEYVTYSLPPSTHPSPQTPDVFLILRLDGFETVLDPAWTVTQSANDSEHHYIFHTDQNDGQMVLVLPCAGEKEGRVAEDLDTLQGILAEYGQNRGPIIAETVLTEVQSPEQSISSSDGIDPAASYIGDKELRGRFVLMNEDNGEIIGALDNHIHVQEDPTLAEKGHEHDPVVVELPEGVDSIEQVSESEILVKAVPPEERDWMFKGAMMARYDPFTHLSHASNLLC